MNKVALPVEGSFEVLAIQEPIDQNPRYQRYSQIEELSWSEAPLLEAQGDAVALSVGVPREQHEIAKVILKDVREHSCNVCNHCVRVGLLSAFAADYVGAEPAEAYLAGLLHDVGKVYVPKETLEKSVAGLETWTQQDRAVMNAHALLGACAIRQKGLPAVIAEAVAQHHALQEREPVGTIDGMTPRSIRLLISLAFADFADAIYRGDHYTDPQTIEDRFAALVKHARYVMRQTASLGVSMKPRRLEVLLADLINTREGITRRVNATVQNSPKHIIDISNT